MSAQEQAIAAVLVEVVAWARREIRTEPGHAIPHHRADERVRELLEQVIYETKEN